MQYDQSLVRDTVGFHNHPYGNEQTTLGTDWDGWFGRAFNITVSYDHRTREHTLREVENDTEDAVLGRAHGQLGDGGYYRLDGGFGHRTGDEFDVAEYQRPDQPDTVYVENPNLRRYDVANRDRTSAAGGWAGRSTPRRASTCSSTGTVARRYRTHALRAGTTTRRWMLLDARRGDRSGLTTGWTRRAARGYGRKDTDQGSQGSGASARRSGIGSGGIIEANVLTGREHLR